MSDEELLRYYQQGYIPGPYEDEFSFIQRTQKKREHHARIPQELFGFAIDWIPITVSNKKLLPWEAAAVWIGEGVSPHIQLRKSLFGTKFFLKDSSEFLAHEGVHAARALFEEPQFEEILAYQTSKKKFRKFWGPLFRSSQESCWVFLTLFSSIFFSWAFCFAFPLVGYFIVRLVRSQRIFAYCLKKTSYPFILCLTDEEILLFSKIAPVEIVEYLNKQQSQRYRLLKIILSSVEKKG